MTKTITLEFTNYVVKGVSDVTPWGGGEACIQMDSFQVKSIDKKTLLENINDGGFGVESINGAICDIYENYSGTLRFLKTVNVGKVSEHAFDHYNEIL